MISRRRRMPVVAVLSALLAVAAPQPVAVQPTPAPSPAPAPSPPLLAGPLPQQPPLLDQADVDKALAALDGLVQDAMKQTGVPGVAVGVVYGDKVVFAKGYGVRKVGEPGAVGADTVFQLASLSKPVASTVVAGVVGDGKVAWDDPVVKHDPGFALKDPWVTRDVTVADLFAHRSGLPDHAGDLLEDLGYDRAYILSHLRLEPLAPFRASYFYTNFGLTAAALAVAKAAGTSWEQLSAQTLYRPLGMSHTSSDFADYEKNPDRAVGHVKVGDAWQAKYVRDPQAQSPAGGVSSTVDDMVKWMRLQLGGGKYDGRQVVDAMALQQTHEPHNTASPPRAPDGVPGFYGLGFNVGYDQSGRLRLGHSGAFDLGAATNVAMIPGEGLGIVVLTNAQPIGVAESIAYNFLDIASYGRQTTDWLPFLLGVFAKIDSEGTSKTDYAKPPANPAAARPSAAYTGTYANAYYGPLTVAERDGKLVMTLGPQGQAFPLTHFDADTFSYRTTGENAVGLDGVTFTVDGAGPAGQVRVAHLDANGLGTFTRG
ncbi:serine hydrolase [Catellatospora methionotrophica]|uniref:serine hydrolase n=1 Tax=Catellatospora methionotrophica TaxID=121620 RepID=UPI00140B64C7|nr:serine hydrolase [Catellatospora methionotrophica]